MKLSTIESVCAAGVLKLAMGMFALGLGGCRSDAPGSVDPSNPGPSSSVASKWIELQPGLTICPEDRAVEIEAEICLDSGWLEQVMCGPGTREHESIMVTAVSPSAVHAALLAVGMQSGSPGLWTQSDGEIIETPPTGSVVDVLVAVDGSDEWSSVNSWIEGDSGRPLEGEWVFGGSFMRAVDEVPSGYSRYEADLSGSIVGLVTFGDETIGLSRVIPDQVAIEPAEWKIREGSVPAIGSSIRVRIRSADR
ncbi:MAG: hypothetical protein CMJ40_07005 [Phycisphaerae bacterium]|nr:hypothetical protein [Phycisphaerae bacterium]